MARILADHPAPDRTKPLAALAYFPELSTAVHRDAGGLVYTAEVGRQPWIVYGVLRTAQAMTPFLTARAATTSLVLFAVVYAFIFSFGIYYIHQLLRAGP